MLIISKAMSYGKWVSGFIFVYTVFVQRSVLRLDLFKQFRHGRSRKHIGIYVKCPSVLSEVKKNHNISTYFSITGDAKFSENPLLRLSSLTLILLT